MSAHSEFTAPVGWVPRSAAEQKLHEESHPVSLREYTLPTPSIELASNLAIERVRDGAQCCGFIGPPRSGKTTAAGYIAADIQERVPNAYVIALLCRQDKARSESNVCDWWSRITGGPPVRSRREDPMIALVRRWVAEALSASAQRLAIVLDEIGRLTEDQLTTLADVQNLIARERMRTTFVVFGSLETVAMKNSLLQIGRSDLIGRFLSRLHQFEGIKTKAELRKVMNAFDDPEIADYPPGSGCAFSQFYLPKPYARGWRLAHCADELWAEFKAASPKKQMQIGAEYVFYAIEHFLKKSMSFEDKEVDTRHWTAAVLESSYQDSLFVSTVRSS